MRKVNLNLYSPGTRNNSGAGALLLLTAALLAAWLVTLHNEAIVEQQRIQSLMAEHNSAKSEASGTDSRGQSVAAQFQRAAAVIEQLSFPWNKLLRAIEDTTGADVALLAVQPDVAAKTTTLDGEAKNWASMASFVKRLKSDGFFSDVHFVSHQTQQSDPQRPVRFRLLCTWQAPS